MELSDKVKLELIDLQKVENDHDHDLTAEIPELAECLATLQSANRSVEDFELNLSTIRELSALINAGYSKNIQWNMITKLGDNPDLICICDEDDTEEEWIRSSKENFDRIFQRLPRLKSCGFKLADLADRDCSGLVESFLGSYYNATGKRRLKVGLFDYFRNVVKELGVLLVHVKNTMGISGSLLVDTSFLEESGPLNPAEFDVLSKHSAKFVLGSAECTVSAC